VSTAKFKSATEGYKPDRAFRVSPDVRQSKDWIDVKLYSDLDTIKKMQGGTEYLDEVIVKMGRTPGGHGETIVGFFEAPSDKFRPNSKNGQCAGTIVMIDDPGINIIAHEATHAGHCYASYAMIAIQKSKRLKGHDLHTWYEEALATCVESVVSEITKKLGHRNAITRVHKRTKKIVRP
jgi:hypothetical protein